MFPTTSVIVPYIFILFMVILTKYFVLPQKISGLTYNSTRSGAGHSLNETTTQMAIVCGNSGKMLNDCFEELSPDLVQFLTTTKIPVTGKDISGKCTVFQQGMACIDRYTQKCIENDKKRIFDSNVFGAKTFLNALCTNTEFQAEYLRHKDCFQYIQEDWQRCSSQFMKILADELNTSHLQQDSRNTSAKFMQFCCSRYAYERCIFNSAKFKCHKNSALFVRAIVRMLSTEKHFNNCGKFESLVCRATIFFPSNNVIIATTTILLTLIINSPELYLFFSF